MKKRIPNQTPKIHTYYLIQDGDADSYLYHNKTLFKQGYFFKKGKEAATLFDSQKSKRVISYLKSTGFTNCIRKKVRK